MFILDHAFSKILNIYFINDRFSCLKKKYEFNLLMKQKRQMCGSNI
jgi:hypothetical protein